VKPTERMKIRTKRETGNRLLFAAQLAAVLLFCLLSLFQSSVPHHHSDDLPHADCPYCAFSSVPVVPTIGGGAAPFVTCVIFLKPLDEALGLTPFYGSIHAIRAPPALS